MAAERISPRPVLVDYRAEWPARAAALIADITAACGPATERIEHIGSTSIPGMAAKDVLDIQVSAADFDLATLALDPPLRAIGFRPTEIAWDHVPAGRDDDPGLWTKRFWWRRDHPAGDVNLHLRLSGSPGERLALLFRDWFRAHPAAIPAYAQFKRSLAAVCADADTYSDVKDPVVDLVITVAEQWAASTGWQIGRG